MTEQPNSAAEFFDGYAADFSAIYGNRNSLFNRVINPLFRQAMRVRYEKSPEGCRPIEGRTVLGVGRGPGHVGGFLAWQRKLRYKTRRELYLYAREQLETLLRRSAGHPYAIEPIGRDFFVTIDCSGKP